MLRFFIAMKMPHKIFISFLQIMKKEERNVLNW